jgi:pyrimidine operon attenuation protein/uracil phosphoribosyltransferase
MMKPNPLRNLEAPPSGLAGRVMADARAWRRPLNEVTWLVGAETVALAALLLVGSATLPARLDETAATIQTWSVELVQATADFSDKVGGLLLPEEEGGIL